MSFSTQGELDPKLGSTGSGNVQTQSTDTTLQKEGRKRKRNQLTPLNRSLEEEEEITNKRKLSSTVKEIMKVIEKLINEISEETKREIRSITTELKTLSDIIEAEHMLECLKPQTSADENEDTDTEDVISVKEDNLRPMQEGTFGREGCSRRNQISITSSTHKGRI